MVFIFSCCIQPRTKKDNKIKRRMERHQDQFSSSGQPGLENERADSMMRQRMARAAQQQQQQQQQQPPPGAYMQQQQPRGTMAPQGAAPSMPMPRPGPSPVGAPRAVTALTGPGRRIPPNADPVRSYKNVYEKNTGIPNSNAQPDMINGVNQLLFGVVTALGFSAIFVLPRQLQVFWVLIVGLTLLMCTGMHMYKEMIQLGNSGGEDSVRQAEYAWMLLFSLMGVYSAVMVGILVFMSWSLYGISNARTNITRSDMTTSSGHHHHRPSSHSSKE